MKAVINQRPRGLGSETFALMGRRCYPEQTELRLIEWVIWLTIFAKGGKPLVGAEGWREADRADELTRIFENDCSFAVGLLP